MLTLKLSQGMDRIKKVIQRKTEIHLMELLSSRMKNRVRSKVTMMRIRCADAFATRFSV